MLLLPRFLVFWQDFESSKTPLLSEEGWLRHQSNAAKPPLKGADRGRSPRKPDRAQPLIKRWFPFGTTPDAPSKEREHFFDGASTPPNLGGEFAPYSFRRIPTFSIFFTASPAAASDLVAALPRCEAVKN